LANRSSLCVAVGCSAEEAGGWAKKEEEDWVANVEDGGCVKEDEGCWLVKVE
jgi:hypothetical protein